VLTAGERRDRHVEGTRSTFCAHTARKVERLRNRPPRWDPFADLAELRSRFDRFLADGPEGRDRPWSPAIDVMREDGNVIVRADVPGLKPDEVKITTASSSSRFPSPTRSRSG
jgi:hypothetical protein